MTGTVDDRGLFFIDPQPFFIPSILASTVRLVGGSDHRQGPGLLDLADIRHSLRALMWRSVGITREARGLTEAADQVDFWCRYALNHVFDDPEGWTSQNMLTVARLMIASAQAREESRGVHTRTDFPDTDPAQAQHISMKRPPLAGEVEEPRQLVMA
jgi:L-aspartate oxidase